MVIVPQVDDFLKGTGEVLTILREYQGATEMIKKAIETPALADEAWATVVPLVKKLDKVYEFSERLGACLEWGCSTYSACRAATGRRRGRGS
jgi:hypothetical protein